MPLLSLVNVIVTPGRTPPCASFSVPVIVAVVNSCADDMRGPKTISTMANPAIQRRSHASVSSAGIPVGPGLATETR